MRRISEKKLPHLAILKNFKVFFRKETIIFPKTPDFAGFENFYSPSVFNSKFATIWWKKFHVQNEPTSFLLELNRQTSGLKNGPIWEEDFAFIFLRKWCKIKSVCVIFLSTSCLLLYQRFRHCLFAPGKFFPTKQGLLLLS